MSKFVKGESGNPQGRPKGIVDKRLQLSKLLFTKAEAIVDKVIELAIEGDINALRLCVERLIPKAKDEAVIFPFSAENMSSISALLNGSAETIKAVSAGEITPEQGHAFAVLLETQHKFIVNSEIEQRLAAIEETLKARQQK